LTSKLENKIKFAKTGNKNEKQQDAKNNAELSIKWTKTLKRPLKRRLDEGETGRDVS